MRRVAGIPALEQSPRARGREAELASSELLSPAAVSIEASASTLEYANHGLGYRYTGAIIVGQSAGGGEARVLTPEQVATNGEDPREVVGVAFSASFTGTLNLRVF